MATKADYGIIIERIKRKAHQRLEQYADELAEEVRQIHLQATPGRGQNINDFGYARSRGSDPPAIEYGELYSSISVDVGPDDIKVGTDVGYAGFLEFGTSRMAARPLWLVAKNRLLARYGGDF